jgi:hypothetical protein
METELIPLYKAQPPFMPNAGEFGYMGVVMWEPISDKLQCNICGELFEHLSRHVFQKHQITSTQYKERYGLHKSTPLVSKSISDKLTQHAKKEYIQHKESGKNDAFIKQAGVGAAKGQRAKPFSVQEMNVYATCPLQIDTRFDNAMAEVGETPTIRQLSPSLWAAIQRRFGTYKNYLKLRKIKPKRMYNLTKEDIFKALDTFHETYNDYPVLDDIRGGRVDMVKSLAPFKRLFGKWSTCLEEYEDYKLNK